MLACSLLLTQNNLGEKVFSYSPSSREARAGTQGRNLETGSEAETTGKCCLPAYPLFSTQLPFLRRPGQVLREGTTNRAELSCIN